MTTEAANRPIEHYLQEVEQRPNSPAAHFNLGLAYTRRGMVDLAERQFRETVELDPDLIEGWVNLGGALLLKWDFNGSIEANRQALERDGELLLAYYNIGQAHLYLGDAEGVVRSCRRVVELDPQHAGGHYFLAVGLLAAGRESEAREEQARARALGHSPAPEFLRALETAEQKTQQATNTDNLIEIGADAPTDSEREA